MHAKMVDPAVQRKMVDLAVNALHVPMGNCHLDTASRRRDALIDLIMKAESPDLHVEN